MRAKAESDGGFTMIEALVALAVSRSLFDRDRNACSQQYACDATVDDRLSLVETARAVLAALPDRDQLALGDFRGEIGDIHWRVDVLPFAADFVDPAGKPPWVPQAVVIRVESPTGQILRLDTVRLRRNPGFR